jgi:GDSL-like lipase/acylhydrolase family protein
MKPMRVTPVVLLGLTATAWAGDTKGTVTVDSMVTVVFTGDSQSCGRNLAIDFPQLISRLIPARVINTAVGGSSSNALLQPTLAGTVRIKKGAHRAYSLGGRWGMGPFPGMKVRIGKHTYTIDHIVEHHRPKRKCELHLVAPAEADYVGTDCEVEPGWQVRVAAHRPQVVCFMYINDGDMPAARQANWKEMIRRIKAMGAVPVLMSPVPIQDKAHGGPHPGSNSKYVKATEIQRRIAAENGCWFIDVFNLYKALDPPMRGVVRDGIHPDTDGSTLINSGLMWVFEQMGLLDARPFFKGWRLTAALKPLPTLLSTGVKPFAISQPDHPNPDRELTHGFTLEAIRRNDMYGLLAERDGHSLAVGKGLLVQCALDRAGELDKKLVRVEGKGLRSLAFWLPRSRRWRTVTLGSSSVPVPASALADRAFHVCVAGARGATLDWLAVDVGGDGLTARPKWKPRRSKPREYRVAGDHAKRGNLIRNAAFTADGADWTLSRGASLNRPFTKKLASVSFLKDKKRRLTKIEGDATWRATDVVMLSGSTAGNNGAFRLRSKRARGLWDTGRRYKALERNLKAKLIHNDGCGLVDGDSCVEVTGSGRASQKVALPKGAKALRLSFFHRVFDPKGKWLGTRDVPGSDVRVSVRFRGAADRSWTIDGLHCSFQWQKFEGEHAVPAGATSCEVVLQCTPRAVVQYTGVYLGVGR